MEDGCDPGGVTVIVVFGWANADEAQRTMETLAATRDFISLLQSVGLRAGVAIRSLFENLAGNADRGDGVGPARVEGELGDRLDDLLFGHAIALRERNVGAELVRAV